MAPDETLKPSLFTQSSFYPEHYQLFSMFFRMFAQLTIPLQCQFITFANWNA